MNRSRVASILVILSCLCLLIWISIAIGLPHRPGLLPDKGSNWGCGTCHTNPAGGGPRNDFGQDYSKVAVPAGDKYTDELGKLDSDGDGFTNDEEFGAKPPTHPGDESSHPEEKPKPTVVRLRRKKCIVWAQLKKVR